MCHSRAARCLYTSLSVTAENEKITLPYLDRLSAYNSTQDMISSASKVSYEFGLCKGMARASRVALNPVPPSNSVLWHLTQFSLLPTAEHFCLRRVLVRPFFLSPSVFVCYVTRPVSVESLHFSIFIIIIGTSSVTLCIPTY
jgi:hypothetical protein